VAGPHVSSVQTFPSSQFWVPPPPVHDPDEHVLGFVHARLAHDPDTHVVPSAALLQAVAVFVVVHTWQAFPGFAWPSEWQAPPIRHEPAASGFEHPATASQVSVVQARPSTHDCVAPPPVHSPNRHVFPAVHVCPAHDGAWHDVPSPAAVHDDFATTGSQTWHAFAGFATPAA